MTSSRSSGARMLQAQSCGYVPYFDYHGVDPNAYYGVPYRQVQYSLNKATIDSFVHVKETPRRLELM